MSHKNKNGGWACNVTSTMGKSTVSVSIGVGVFT